MRSLRLTQEDLDAILKRRDAAKVKTHVLQDETTKLIVQILLSDIKAADLPVPDLEHRFHEVRKWRFDLAWIEDKVAIEIEGGIWVRGRHSRGAGMEADMEKYNEAQLLGWTVLRYSTGQVKQGKPIEDVKRALA